MKEIEIRTATENDAHDMLTIYAPYVLESSVTFEHEVPTLDEFKNRINKTLEKYPFFVALINGKIEGYAYIAPFKTREAYKYSAETSVYVREMYRKSGIGTQLYNELEKTAKRQGIINLNACITSPNPSSIAFHKKFGYTQCALFHQCGYKFDTWYDVVWMEKFISKHTVPTKEFIPFNKL